MESPMERLKRLISMVENMTELKVTAAEIAPQVANKEKYTFYMSERDGKYPIIDLEISEMQHDQPPAAPWTEMPLFGISEP